MTHTPGPWEVIGGTVIHAEIEEIIIATVPEENAVLRFNETRANARLIAAAPEMYALLNEWLDTPFFETKEEWQEWVDEYKPRVVATMKDAEGDA